MRRRRFLQLFGLSPVAVALPTPAREPDLLPVATEKELWHIEPAADVSLWDMATATCVSVRAYTEPQRTVYCCDPYGNRPCKAGAEDCVCQQRIIGKVYVTT